MKYSVMLIVYFLMFLIEALASPRLKGWPEKFEASDNCDGEAAMKGLEAWRCASASAEGGQFLTMGVSAVVRESLLQALQGSSGKIVGINCWASWH